MTVLPGGFGAALAQRLTRRADQERYRRDIRAWAAERLGVHLWSRQIEIAQSVAQNRRTAVRSAAGIGKSFLASIIALWWIDTHPPGEAIVVTTAPTAEQVDAILWEEIRKHHRAGGLAGQVQRSKPVRWVLDDGTLVGLGRKPADHSQSAFQGIHRRYVLVILDEAGGLLENLWVGAEAITTNEDCRILAIGNPDIATSHFANVCLNGQLWSRIKVSALDSPNWTGEWVPDDMRAVLPSRQQILDLREQWGENNPVYRSKVLGEFADTTDGLIPLSWIRQSTLRWHAWQEKRAAEPVRIEPPGRRIFGVDVAYTGADKTAVAVRQGDIINPDGEREIETWPSTDTMQIVDIVTDRLRGRPDALAVIDVGGGWGIGAYDLLARDGWQVTGFNGSRGTKMRDRSGMYRFDRVRPAAWWNVRELLDPSADALLALPPDDDLAAELAAPTWDRRTGGVLTVQEKAETKKVIARSPDRADAVVMACWSDSPGRGADREVAARVDGAPPIVAADSYVPTYPGSGLDGVGGDVWV
jgi:hypothetical protein